MAICTAFRPSVNAANASAYIRAECTTHRRAVRATHDHAEHPALIAAVCPAFRSSVVTTNRSAHLRSNLAAECATQCSAIFLPNHSTVFETVGSTKQSAEQRSQCPAQHHTFDPAQCAAQCPADSATLYAAFDSANC